jgi:phospho-N-acetylmuramoyl-pentapeptide-transferase
MLYWLHEFLRDSQAGSIWAKAGNVLQYVTFRGIVAGLFAMAFTLLIGNFVIRKLLSLKMGQPIRTAEEVRELYALHEGKKGTPTMGGLMILAAFFLTVFLFTRLNDPLIWCVLLIAAGYGFLGFYDDYLKVKLKNSKGVSSRGKLVVQFGIAGLVSWLIYSSNREYFSQLWVPFIKTAIVKDMGWIAILFYMVIIVGSSNAVNVTDGLDGLATGCTIPVAFTYAVFAYVSGHAGTAHYLQIPHNTDAAEICIICFALLGACLGFLWFNCAPARVFMGDTGSLAIGGIIGVVAIASKQELTLLIVGSIYVVEALSVMLQVSYYKYTRWKTGIPQRLLLCAPLHHHYERKGIKETQIVIRFWILSLVCAFVGIATLKLR